MRDFVEKNLWAILAAIATAWSGYLTGQATMQADIEALKALKPRIEALENFRACVTRHIDRLENGGKGPLPCPLSS